MADQDHLKRLRKLPEGSVIAIRRAQYTVGQNFGPKGPHNRVELGLVGKKGAAYMLWLPADARYVARFASLRGMGRGGVARDLGVGDIRVVEFSQNKVLDEANISEIGARVGDLVQASPNKPRLMWPRF